MVRAVDKADAMLTAHAFQRSIISEAIYHLPFRITGSAMTITAAMDKSGTVLQYEDTNDIHCRTRMKSKTNIRCPEKISYHLLYYNMI